MAGETKADISAFTVDSLHVHLLHLMDERDRRYAERFDAQEKAVAVAIGNADKFVDRAEQNAQKWRENANEWRGAMNDREIKLMPRAEVESVLAAINRTSEARAASNSEKIATLEKRLERSEGKASGYSAGFGYILAAIGLATGIISIVTVMNK